MLYACLSFAGMDFTDASLGQHQSRHASKLDGSAIGGKGLRVLGEMKPRIAHRFVQHDAVWSERLCVRQQVQCLGELLRSDEADAGKDQSSRVGVVKLPGFEE